MYRETAASSPFPGPIRHAQKRRCPRRRQRSGGGRDFSSVNLRRPTELVEGHLPPQPSRRRHVSSAMPARSLLFLPLFFLLFERASLTFAEDKSRLIRSTEARTPEEERQGFHLPDG